ncbi:MAG: RDD family protein [Acidimicrobiia bacterium]|nr:RDD family protein [Acidimicrobiia bacterium]MYE72478.1 RDD family protein [Acidimicrobiia bacterium]MYJ60689.1 RDD family protein [Acidimicrobiia bacterium]
MRAFSGMSQAEAKARLHSSRRRSKPRRTPVDDEEFPEGATIVDGPDGKPYPVAAVWRRALARIIDAVTVFFIQWMLTVIQLLWFMDDVSTRWQPEPWGRATAAILGYIFFHFVYTMVFLRWNEGQTPAMDLMKLRAVRTKDGGHLGLGRCGARWLVGGVSWILPPVVLGGIIVNAATYLTVPFDRRRRTVSDWVAGTTVIAYNRDKEDPDGLLEEVLDEFGQPMTVREQIRRKYGLFGGLTGIGRQVGGRRRDRPDAPRDSQSGRDSLNMSATSGPAHRKQGERSGI